MFLKSKSNSRDKDRVPYDITFPHELEYDRVVSWLRAISRTTASRGKRNPNSHSIGFEVEADQSGICWRLLVPWQIADDIAGQTRALMPGVNIQQAERPLRPWRYAVELGEKNKSMPLAIAEPSVLSHSLLASLTPLAAGERIVVQWVVSPAPLVAPPSAQTSVTLMNGITLHQDADVVKGQRNKLSDVNFMCVARVASCAETDPRARHLADRVLSSFRSTSSHQNRWVVNNTRLGGLLERVKNAASLTVWPAQLAVSELAAFVAWKIDNPHVSGLPRGASRHLPAPANVPQDGIRLGNSTFPGAERPIALSQTDTMKHMWFIGPTGSGKTTLVSNVVRQVMEAGSGLMLVETKGDLFHSVIRQIPKHRLDDVVVLDINDTEHPVGYNLLQGDPLEVLDDLESIMSSIYRDDKGVWLKEVLENALQTLATRPGATIADIVPLLSPRYDEREWRDELVRSLRDPNLKHYWQVFENQGQARSDQKAAPVMSRFTYFGRPQIRAVFGQRESGFTMEDVLRGNKILLINLAGINSSTMQLVGSLMVNNLRREVWKRKVDKPFYLVADEVQNVMHLPIGMDDLLSQARSFGLGLIMANQSPSQLPTTILNAAEANARTKIAFQLELSDAKLMSRQFGYDLTEHDFMNLQNYDAYARVATPEGVSAPMSFHSQYVKPSGDTERRVRLMSRSRYGRPIADVEREIQEWRRASDTTRSQRRRRPVSE